MKNLEKKNYVNLMTGEIIEAINKKEAVKIFKADGKKFHYKVSYFDIIPEVKYSTKKAIKGYAKMMLQGATTKAYRKLIKQEKREKLKAL